MAVPTTEEAMRLAIEAWRSRSPEIRRLWSNMGQNRYAPDLLVLPPRSYREAATAYQTGHYRLEWGYVGYRRLPAITRSFRGPLVESRIQAMFRSAEKTFGHPLLDPMYWGRHAVKVYQSGVL